MTMPDHRSELEKAPCPECHGQREVWRSHPVEDGDPDYRVDCPNCHGTGWTAREQVADPWRHKDEWGLRADSFLVVVTRHPEPRPDGRYDRGEHRWAVYAYVYPQHPLFAQFNPNGGMFGQPDLHGHWSPSFYRAHCDFSGAIKSHQIGWDYAHDGDERFSFMATRDEASEVFWDAQKLYDELAGWTARERATMENANV